MRQKHKLIMALLLTIFAVALAQACSGAKAEGKIPITTSSEEALDYYIQGRDLAEKLRGIEAVDLFEKAIEADPDFALAHFSLAAVQPTTKLFFASFNRAKELADQVSEAEKMLITGFAEGAINGNPVKQRETYKQLTVLFPNDERALTTLGTNYFVQQEWELAIEQYERAAEINPEYTPLYNQLGYSLRFSNKYPEAEKVFKKYIELIPNDPNPYDSYAELLMKMGKFAESIEQYRAALRVKPDFIFSNAGIASNFNFMGKHEKAREQLKSMYDEATTDAQRRQALGGIANSFLDEQMFDEAIAQWGARFDLDKKLNDTSAMAGALTLRAYTVIEVEGRADEALKDFQAAMRLVEASSVPEAAKINTRRNNLFNLGRAYGAMGDLEKAKVNAGEFRKDVELLNNAFQIKRAFHLEGLIALAEGSYDKAIEDFTQSNMQNPYNLFHLAEAYDGKGDKDKAKEYYELTANFNGLNNGLLASVRMKAVNKVSEMM